MCSTFLKYEFFLRIIYPQNVMAHASFDKQMRPEPALTSALWFLASGMSWQPHGCRVIITDKPATVSLNHTCAGMVMNDMRNSLEMSEGTESIAPAPPTRLQKRRMLPWYI